MVNIFFPVFDLINGLLEKIFPFAIQNLIWGIIAGGLAFIVYWLLSNQTKIAEIKNDMKFVRKKMFDQALEDKTEYNRLAKQNLSLSFKLLNNIFLPAIISILPVIIIAVWYDMNYSYNLPNTGDSLYIETIPKTNKLVFDPLEASDKDINGNVFLQSFNTDQKISIFNNNVLVYNGKPFTKPIPYITHKKWWNIFLSSPIGYLSSETDIDVVIFHYSENIQFENMPDIINGWELVFFVGIFISALPLRIFFKVQ